MRSLRKQSLNAVDACEHKHATLRVLNFVIEVVPGGVQAIEGFALDVASFRKPARGLADISAQGLRRDLKGRAERLESTLDLCAMACLVLKLPLLTRSKARRHLQLGLQNLLNLVPPTRSAPSTPRRSASSIATRVVLSPPEDLRLAQVPHGVALS